MGGVLGLKWGQQGRWKGGSGSPTLASKRGRWWENPNPWHQTAANEGGGGGCPPPGTEMDVKKWEGHPSGIEIEANGGGGEVPPPAGIETGMNKGGGGVPHLVALKQR